MPIHIHPYFRALEKNVWEPSGIYKSIDSLGYTVQAAEETANKRPAPPATLFKNHKYLGQNYDLTLP